MFLGHFGLGMGAKRLAPKTSLGTLFMAAQFLDLLWPVFLVLGWEKVIAHPSNPPLLQTEFIFPYSHGLLFSIGWSLLFGLVYYAIKRDRRTAILLGLLVFSHWVLDLFFHERELVLVPWSDVKVGFGLWQNTVVTICLEALLFIGGIALYLGQTRARSWVGHVSFWSLMLVLAGIYASGFFGPPPSDSVSVGWTAMIQYVLIAWAYWVDRTRMVV